MISGNLYVYAYTLQIFPSQFDTASMIANLGLINFDCSLSYFHQNSKWLCLLTDAMIYLNSVLSDHKNLQHYYKMYHLHFGLRQPVYTYLLCDTNFRPDLETSVEYEDTPEFRQSLNMEGVAKEAILKKLRDRLGMKDQKK